MKVKSAVDHQEQVKILKSKGLIIENRRECIEFLQRTNYYRLSVYCEAFRYEGKGRFIEGTTFEQIKNVYMFDQRLRALLFEIVEDIEFTLRTQISYYHGSKYGAQGYLDPTTFSKLHSDRNFKHHLKTVISENKDSPVIQHHKNKYDGKFPLWVIIEFFSMGMLSMFYRDMMLEDKSYIARMYSTTAACMETWVQCVTEVRNRCAHYSRFYNWKFRTAPVFQGEQFPKYDFSVFGHFLVLRNMYPDSEEWNGEFMQKLDHIMENYSKDIRLEHLGFPSDWRKCLKGK